MSRSPSRAVCDLMHARQPSVLSQHLSDLPAPPALDTTVHGAGALQQRGCARHSTNALPRSPQVTQLRQEAPIPRPQSEFLYPRGEQ
jgi:hypothetical protein